MKNASWLMLAIAVGCQTKDDTPDNTGTADSSPTTDEGCSCTELGADFGINPDIPNGDPETWGALPPDALVSTTCLRTTPTEEGAALFEETKAPVIAQMMAAPIPGLMGLSLGGSASCTMSRTLTIWATEADMVAFVTGDAHAEAASKMGEISRGGSKMGHWKVSDLPAVGWAEVAAALEDYDGPEY